MTQCSMSFTQKVVSEPVVVYQISCSMLVRLALFLGYSVNKPRLGSNCQIKSWIWRILTLLSWKWGV